MFRGEDKKNKKGKVKKGKAFVLSHCYDKLKDEEKWKKRDVLEVPSIKEVLNLDEDEASSDGGKRRSPTPNSVNYANPRRPTGAKIAKERKKGGGDDDLKHAMEEMVKARRLAMEERKLAQEAKQKKNSLHAETEARKVAAEERRLALEEKKLEMAEQARMMEWEKYLFFMETSHFDDKQKEYLNIRRDELLMKKRMMGMGGVGGTMGGFGGIGTSMEGMGGNGGMGVMNAPPMGMGCMSFGSLLGGMGPYGGMGGMGGPDRKSTRLNSSHITRSRMPSSA